MQWNCRSIFTNQSCFSQYISNNTYHVLSLQSLNVKKNKLPKFKGYFFPPIINSESFTINAKVSTAIYIRDDLDYVFCQSPVPKNTNDVFSAAVQIKINKTTSANILSVYYPTGPNNTNSEWLRSINITSNWIITGDFNAHSPIWDTGRSDVTCARFVDNIVDSGMILLNDGRITRIPDISTHHPSALDLTLITPALAIDSVVYEPKGSIGTT